MRRLSHNRDWGFAPVLSNEKLYPRSWPFQLDYQATGTGARGLAQHLSMTITPTYLDIEDLRFAIPYRNRVQRYEMAEFLGVAVEYGRLPRLLAGSGFGRIAAYVWVLFQKLLRRPMSEDVDGVLLYLMHERREHDLLLYFADDEMELLAQWQFWSQKLKLPKLIVSADGFIHEPEDRLGGLFCRAPFNRDKDYTLFKRRSLFRKLRGCPAAGGLKPLEGREIMARR